MSPADPDRASLLAPLREEPEHAAVLLDVDGTLAPIVEDPRAAVPLPRAVTALESLTRRLRLVGFVSGRRAAEVREMLGLEDAAYVGNHGLERLDAGSSVPRASETLGGHESEALRFASAISAPRLDATGLRIEDKGAILGLHWRGAADEQAAAAEASAIAAEAEAAGLRVHHGRKVIELRPAVEFDKGLAVAELLSGSSVAHTLYAGDDRTDVDAFRRLRAMAADGSLQSAVCVGIASPESPPEVSAEADLVVAHPAEVAALLEALL